jgi:homoserine dehydrogenase
MRVMLAGFGSVGMKVAELLESEVLVGVSDSKGAVYDERGIDVGRLIELKRGYGSVAAYPAERLGSTGELLDREADVFIEATPTRLESDEAFLSISRAMFRGMDVVTSNKAPMANHFYELESIAEQRGVKILYSATVGGGTRMLSMARELAAGAGVEAFYGVLNGTCNYILTRMKDEGLPFDSVLREAKELGYAEEDPSYDIDGVDSALKLQIMAQSVMRMEKKKVEIRGIRGISERALRLAEKEGYSVRLVGVIEKSSLSVTPRLVPRGHPLDVNGTKNAFLFRTRHAGDIEIRGSGSGGSETASSVIADMRAMR